MKTRDLLIIGALGVGAYLLFFNKKGTPTSTADFIPGGSSYLPFTGATPLTSGFVLGTSIFDSLSNLFNSLTKKDSTKEPTPPESAGYVSPVASYLNEIVQRQTGVAGSFQTAIATSKIGSSAIVVQPTGTYANTGVNLVALQKAAETAGIETGYGIGSYQGGGIMVSSQQLYQPSGVVSSGSALTATKSIPNTAISSTGPTVKTSSLPSASNYTSLMARGIV